MPVFQTDHRSSPATAKPLRRRHYGVIEVVDGRFRRVLLRPWPTILVGPEVLWLGQWMHQQRRGRPVVALLQSSAAVSQLPGLDLCPFRAADERPLGPRRPGSARRDCTPEARAMPCCAIRATGGFPSDSCAATAGRRTARPPGGTGISSSGSTGSIRQYAGSRKQGAGSQKAQASSWSLPAFPDSFLFPPRFPIRTPYSLLSAFAASDSPATQRIGGREHEHQAEAGHQDRNEPPAKREVALAQEAPDRGPIENRSRGGRGRGKGRRGSPFRPATAAWQCR